MIDVDAILDSFYSAYNRHDASGAADFYKVDGWHDEKAMNKRRSGKAQISEGLMGIFNMLPDVVWHEEQRIISGASAAVNYTMTGTMTPRTPDANGAVRPRQIILKGLHLFEFTDSLLTGTADYWNLDQFKQQIK